MNIKIEVEECTGSDSGFIFQFYGFAYIREMELLREAGFHPLEVIRSIL